MNPADISNARDGDLRASFAALRRASVLARQEAIRTNTDLVVVEAGKLTIIEAAQLRRQSSGEDK